VADATHFLAPLSIDARIEALEPKACRPLHTAQIAIGFALERFHESWTAYRSITPTLYAIAPTRRGVYVTLGRLRSRFAMDWDLVDAAFEALASRHAATGYLVATAATGGDPLRALFGVQGHDLGERHYGALDLRTLQPFEASFGTELDMPPQDWRDRWQEAVTNTGIAKHAVSQ
jgi:hypothetical protein